MWTWSSNAEDETDAARLIRLGTFRMSREWLGVTQTFTARRQGWHVEAEEDYDIWYPTMSPYVVKAILKRGCEEVFGKTTGAVLFKSWAP